MCWRLHLLCSYFFYTVKQSLEKAIPLEHNKCMTVSVLWGADIGYVLSFDLYGQQRCLIYFFSCS